jgi:hypothetical protein
MAGVLRDDLSYDDGIELHALVARELRSIIRMALQHPDARTVMNLRPLSPTSGTEG